jgi:prepilin-type N-terminal cleavage/methylation domain-containing protein
VLVRIRKAIEEKDEGFTLIELLVVMIIIGILAAIAIPVFLSQKKKGYEASMKSDLRSIATEITTQAVDQPATITVTQPADPGPVLVTAAGSTDPGSIALSPGSSLQTGTVDVPNNIYCVGLTNSKSNSSWAIYKTAAGSAQTIAKGTCSGTGFVAG